MITYHPTSTAEGNHCFSLEQEGENVLIVIGLTPNTGTDIEPDDMTKSIMRFMDAYGYDGFVILNISSERCDNSDHLSAEPDFQMHKKNLDVISKLNEKYDSSDILVCFGGGFNKRMYLQKFLVDIHNILSHHKRWLSTSYCYWCATSWTKIDRDNNRTENGTKLPSEEDFQSKYSSKDGYSLLFVVGQQRRR